MKYSHCKNFLFDNIRMKKLYTKKQARKIHKKRTFRKVAKNQKGGFNYSDFKKMYFEDVYNIKLYDENIFTDRTIIKKDNNITNDDEVTTLYSINERISSFIKKYYLLNTTESIDKEWIYKSISYVENLPKLYKFMLRGYTYHGDELVNTYLRNKDAIKSHPLLRVVNKKYGIAYAVQLFAENGIDFESYIKENGYITKEGSNAIEELLSETSDDQIIKCIDKYIFELVSIIDAAPRLSKQITVFRGVKDDYFSKEEGKVVSNKGFVSTTFDINTVKDFSNYYIYRIQLNINTPCICLIDFSEHGEFEVLVSPNTLTTIGNSSYIFDFDYDEIIDDMYALEDPFEVGLRRYKIRDMSISHN